LVVGSCVHQGRRAIRTAVRLAIVFRLSVQALTTSSNPKECRDGARPIVSLLSDALHIRIHHHPDERLEVRLGLPAELCFRFGRISEYQIDLSWTEERRVDDNIVAVVEANVTEGNLTHVSDSRVSTRSDHVIVRLWLLEHEPHGLD